MNCIKHTIALITCGLLASSTLLSAQGTKPVLSKQGQIAPAPENLTIRKDVKSAVPIAENPFGLPKPIYKPLPLIRNAQPADNNVRILYDAAGQAIFWDGKTAESDFSKQGRPIEIAAVEYVASLSIEGVASPAQSFITRLVQTDEQGNQHVRMQQIEQGVPIYGAELIAHTQEGVFQRLNGRYFPTPVLTTFLPALTTEQAVELVKSKIGRVKETWSEMDLKIIGGQPFRTQLVVYHVDEKATEAHLAWHVEGHPNLMSRVVYFIDTQSGAVLNHYDHTCDLGLGRLHNDCGHDHSAPVDEDVLVGPVTGNGTDLLGVSRSFGAWQQGSTYYMEDASQPMFNSGSSQMPNDPVGAIVTVDAKNTSPANESSFDYQLVTSNSSNFNNTNAVSTHYNSIQSYNYFKQKFNRNSIDGVGGNIIAFFNVADDDGGSMENAFWNGAAMWYGNGGSTFKKLARGLDVGGHEMTHGVVEKTANLEYQNESGALNESFADVFGASIDGDDWRVGEDVMQPSTHTCLRDLSNPNNGVSSNSPWWQPAHYNERYTGTQDNGGVHINSGIVNKAYYLFATASGVGRDKAEQVYYKALRDFLTKSSRFIDCRNAVIQASTDLYGSSVANAAAAAFDQVGILGNAPPTANPFGQLATNPGTDYVLCVSDDFNSIDLADGSGNVLGTVYDAVNIKSRPSITDDGTELVFVNENKHIIYIQLSYGVNIDILNVTQLSNAAEWRSAAISKDGRFVSGVTDFLDNRIYVFDLVGGGQEAFELYNPTYTQGQVTGDVSYADVMEFDYEGASIVYDAYNEVNNSAGEDLSYWDIGFVQFWENGQFTSGATPPISKLFSGLPENSSVGDPAFSKNSPFIMAFDFYSGIDDQNDIYGLNLEKNDYEVIVTDNTGFGWPNYNRLDNSIIFHEEGTFGSDILRRGVTNTKINPQGNITNFIDGHVYGVWYGAGTRSLQVGTITPDPAFLNLRVSPNPTSERLTVQSVLLNEGAVLIRLNDLMGRTVYEQRATATTGENTWSVDLSALPTGHYLLRCSSDFGQASVKVIKN